MKKYFSDNVIFMDTEFTSLDPSVGELLAIALVKPDGTELYLEIEHKGEISDPWVKENVLPYLEAEKKSREEAIGLIKDFVGPQKPYVVNYVDQFDIPYFYKLIPQKNSPFHWIPIDFAALLFAFGFDPEALSKGRTQLYERLGIDHASYRKHHALDDARLLKEAYLRFAQDK